MSFYQNKRVVTVPTPLLERYSVIQNPTEDPVSRLCSKVN